MTAAGSLFEREDQLAALEKAVKATSELGTVVLVSGEAGHGKTSLVNTVLRTLDHRYRVLRASCEPVGIPAAFAPLFDLLDVLPDELARDLKAGGGRPAVYAGMLDLIKNDRIVLLLEDLHWSDEATMGLVRYLGRRIEATNSSLIVTYRSEELESNPQLRLVIADLGPSAIRIEVPALTLAGVSQMARDLDLDAGALHQATLGNPFFVEEVIRHPHHDLPPTVQNAVLANAGHLPKTAREFLNLVALSHDGVDLTFAESLHAKASTDLDLALQRRLIMMSNDRVACRHELIRESLAQAIPEATKRRLHRQLLANLEAKVGESPDIARLAYHSIGAGDTGKSLTYSLQAARGTAQAGAHRQAAHHYDNALRHPHGTTSEILSEMLLDAAWEFCLINDFDRARNLARERIALAPSELETSRAWAWLAFYESRQNDLDAAKEAAGIAIEGLRNHPVSEELAVALGVAAWVDLAEGHWARAIELGDETERVAQAAGATHVAIYGATTAGTARSVLSDPRGKVQIEEAARMGVEMKLGEFTARAMNNRGGVALSRGRLEEARHWFDQMIEYSAANELDAWYIAGVATRAFINVMSGRWQDADTDLEVVTGQKTCLQTEVEVLVTAATLRSRRADPRSAESIESVLTRVVGSRDHDIMAMGCVLALQGAWMGFGSVQAAQELYVRFLAGCDLDPVLRSRLGFWARRLDFDPPEGAMAGPVGLEWNGQIAEAADAWEQLGFPVETAITRALVPNANFEAVFGDLRRMGAEGVIRGLRRELERRGVKHIPRGERATTRNNPGGLTAREAEVLALIAAGHSNAAIANELFITEKTAGHHVSAVLAKLGVKSRVQAATLAVTNGLVKIGN